MQQSKIWYNLDREIEEETAALGPLMIWILQMYKEQLIAM